MKVSEFLGEVRDELFKGWTKGKYKMGNQVCIVGAIERVTLRHLPEVAVAGQAQAEVDKLAHDIYGHNVVQSFNDFRTTGKQDVLDFVDKAIIGLEERGQ